MLSASPYLRATGIQIDESPTLPTQKNGVPIMFKKTREGNYEAGIAQFSNLMD